MRLVRLLLLVSLTAVFLGLHPLVVAAAECRILQTRMDCSNTKTRTGNSPRPSPGKSQSRPRPNQADKRPSRPTGNKSGAGSAEPPPPPVVRWHNKCGARPIAVDGGHCWVRHEQPRQPAAPSSPSRGQAPVQEAPALPAVPVVTQRDFQSVPLSAGVVHVWPNGWGVAGKRTAFWTEDTTQTKTLTMLGQQVTVEAVPVSWRWDFGDGTVKWTHSPWRKPVSLERAGFYHVYSKAERVKVTVTVRYEGRYRVGDGPWTDIDGTAEKTSPPRDVTVYRYEKYVVSEHCKRRNCLEENRANR